MDSKEPHSAKKRYPMTRKKRHPLIAFALSILFFFTIQSTAEAIPGFIKRKMRDIIARGVQRVKILLRYKKTMKRLYKKIARRARIRKRKPRMRRYKNNGITFGGRSVFSRKRRIASKGYGDPIYVSIDGTSLDISGNALIVECSARHKRSKPRCKVFAVRTNSRDEIDHMYALKSGGAWVCGKVQVSKRYSRQHRWLNWGDCSSSDINSVLSRSTTIVHYNGWFSPVGTGAQGLSIIQSSKSELAQLGRASAKELEVLAAHQTAMSATIGKKITYVPLHIREKGLFLLANIWGQAIK